MGTVELRLTIKYLFRVNQPYLNLLVNLEFFSGFLEIIIILCILKDNMPFKMYKIIFFCPEKKIIKKKIVRLPYLKFSDT